MAASPRPKRYLRPRPPPAWTLVASSQRKPALPGKGDLLEELFPQHVDADGAFDLFFSEWLQEGLGDNKLAIGAGSAAKLRDAWYDMLEGDKRRYFAAAALKRHELAVAQANAALFQHYGNALLEGHAALAALGVDPAALQPMGTEQQFHFCRQVMPERVASNVAMLMNPSRRAYLCDQWGEGDVLRYERQIHMDMLRLGCAIMRSGTSMKAACAQVHHILDKPNAVIRVYPRGLLFNVADRKALDTNAKGPSDRVVNARFVRGINARVTQSVALDLITAAAFHEWLEGYLYPNANFDSKMRKEVKKVTQRIKGYYDADGRGNVLTWELSDAIEGIYAEAEEMWALQHMLRSYHDLRESVRSTSEVLQGAYAALFCTHETRAALSFAGGLYTRGFGFGLRVFELADCLDEVNVKPARLSRPYDVLCGGGRLQVLWLDSNPDAIEVLAADAYALGKVFEGLQVLSLRDGRGNHEHEDDPSLYLNMALSSMPNLLYLDVSYCDLSELPDELPFLCPLLEVLSCEGNHLRHLPANLANCSALRLLFAAKNRINFLGKDLLTGLEFLEHLDVAGNGLGKLLSRPGTADTKVWPSPEGAETLEALRYLDISGNGLRRFPLWVYSLPRVSTVVTGRQLENAKARVEFLSSFSQTQSLAHLEVLDVSGKARTQRAVFAKGKPKACLPDAFMASCFSGRLRVLNLRGLGLDYLPDTSTTVYESLASLTTLDVSDNLLCSLPRGLAELPALKTLLLASNNLGLGEQKWWLVMPRCLEVLDLSNNSFKNRLMPSAAVNLEGLTHLNLAGNYLTMLPGFLQSMSRLRNLRIDENDLPEGLAASIDAMMYPDWVDAILTRAFPKVVEGTRLREEQYGADVLDWPGMQAELPRRLNFEGARHGLKCGGPSEDAESLLDVIVGSFLSDGATFLPPFANADAEDGGAAKLAMNSDSRGNLIVPAFKAFFALTQLAPGLSQEEAATLVQACTTILDPDDYCDEDVEAGGRFDTNICDVERLACLVFAAGHARRPLRFRDAVETAKALSRLNGLERHLQV